MKENTSMKTIILASVFISFPIFAETLPIYRVKMDVNVKGEKVLSPDIKVKEGERATVIKKTKDGERFIDIEVTKGFGDKSDLLMKISTGLIDEMGNRTVISEPELLTTEGKRVEMMVKDFEDKEDISVSAMAIQDTGSSF